MKVKIIGFKVSVSRPTYNKTVEVPSSYTVQIEHLVNQTVGDAVLKALSKSDFLSIRKV